jgi:hypothetical protein
MKKEKVLRISRADRLMAIKRLPEFKRDYEEFLKIKKTGKSDLIAKKAYELEEKYGDHIEAIENAEKIYYEITKKGKDPSFCIRVVHTIEKDPIREFTFRDEGKVTKRWIEGERLYLEVDIKNATKEELIKDFKRIIDRYDDFLPELRKSKKRESKLDHWEVWDRYSQEGRNLLNVTRRIFNVNGNPNFDFDENLYKQVKDAYKRAKNIINSVKLTK